MKSLALIFIGGGLGSVVRYLFGKWISYENHLPVGTLVVNMVACFVLGTMVGLADQRQLLSPLSRLFWTVGFCGGFSTFSTFSYETLQLIQSGNSSTAFLYIALSVMMCLAFTLAGLYAGSYDWNS